MQRIVSVSAFCVFVLASAAVLAHPHFNKTITCQLPGGAEVVITYNTTPANMARAESAPVGTFVTPRRPTLKLSADLTAGSVTIPAGEYTIGVVKKGPNEWVMALYKGGLERGAEPDMANVIELESEYSASEGNAPHMLIDVTPGHGRFEGRAVLTLHFGTMYLQGALS